MKEKRQKESFLARNVEYNGIMSEYQLTGNTLNGKKIGLTVHNSLNSYQNFLYNRVMFGLSVYSQDEIENMHWEKRKRIVKVQKRTREVLNVWKQQIANVMTMRFFERVFPKTEFTAHFIETVNDIDPTFKGTLDLKLLGITKKDIVNKLITEGILPNNFYQLKSETSCR